MHLKQAWHNKFLTRGVGAPSGAEITGGLGIYPPNIRGGMEYVSSPKVLADKTA